MVRGAAAAEGVVKDAPDATPADRPAVEAPDWIELRPHEDGSFDEIVARFADGIVHVETMDDSSVYVGFSKPAEGPTTSGLQLWIRADRKELRYSHSDMGSAPADALARWAEAHPAPPAPPSALDAFEMGFSFALALRGQAMEDSRAVGRLLGRQDLEPIADRIDAIVARVGFDAFRDADDGVWQAKRIIRAALAEACGLPEQPAGPSTRSAWRDVDVRDADLSVRTTRALSKAGYHTLGDVADADDRTLVRVPDLGRMGLADARRRIAGIAAAPASKERP